MRASLGLSQAKLAEASGVAQHLISSFELSKSVLDASDIRKIASLLSNRARVGSIVARKKRYTSHIYEDARRDPIRIAKCKKTEHNDEYIRIINSLSRKRQRSAKPTAISLFSGCGGFSLGFSSAGFDIKGFLEIDDKLRSIYIQNFKHSFELGRDITKLTDDDINRNVQTLGTVDVIIGGPPCQGFSLAGKRDVNDPRNGLFHHYLRLVDAFKPRIAVMENVRLLTSMKSPGGGLVHENITSEFRARGYAAELFEINAKDYGIPQHRERVIFIAARIDTGIKPALPTRTHSADSGAGLFSGLLPYRTFADACSDLPYLESGEAAADPLHAAVSHPKHVIDWLWDVPEGFSAHDNTDPAKRPPSGYNTTYKRQIWREPAATVQTTFGMISGCRNVHPVATRSLTIREAARLQSFPDWYKFEGSLGAARTGIGNAVPPLLGHQIASYLKDLL